MPAKPFPRHVINGSMAAYHGALDYGELEKLGIDPEKVIDFSSNINPYGPPAAAIEAVKDIQWQRYPDRQTLTLRRALAAQLSLPVKQIVAGNGTAELIWLIAFAFVRPGSPVLILGPIFGEYARCAKLAGGVVTSVNGQARDNFNLSSRLVRDSLDRLHPGLVYICNPNNPTGTMIDGREIGRWAEENSNTLFVIDEAYLPFTAGYPSALSLKKNNILVLRSMTKDYALAGLRLGYAAGPTSLVDTIAQVRPAWNVNAAAQAAGLAALREPQFLQNTLPKLQVETLNLVQAFENLGLLPLPSTTNFFVFEVDNAAAFRHQLLTRFHIQTRDCSSFGMPSYIRIATRRTEENALLLDAVARQLQ